MSCVYMVIELAIHDGLIYDRYVAEVQPVVEAHGGRYLVRGGAVTPVSGEWVPERIVVIEFPSMEDLRGCFASAGYRRLASLREASTTSRAVAVEGVSRTTD